MNGVVLIDKPSGRTSHDIVKLIKGASSVTKAGHAGTLDPLATGVLPVCINEGTKLVQFLVHDHKEYRATMLLGTGTDTLDIEGVVIARGESNFENSRIEAVLSGFLGRSEQTPPRYSAIKYKGKPLYKWARAGVQIEPSPRMIEIRSIEVVKIELPYVTFDVSCSKGTYIRSLCRDIGEKLGCPACLAKLRRTQSGYFREDQAFSIEGLNVRQMDELIARSLISLNDALPAFKEIAVEGTLADRVKNGYQPGSEELQGIPSFSIGDMVKLTTGGHRLLAIGRVSDTVENNPEGKSTAEGKTGIKILRVFNP